MDYEDFTPEALVERLDLAKKGEASSVHASLRERFHRCMYYQEVEHIPNFEFGYWASTLDAWHEQGLPESVDDEATAYDYFGIENWVTLPVNTSLTAVCEHEDLEETDEYIIYRDGLGVVAKINKHGDRSIPHYLHYPVKDRETWEPYKEALNPDDESRYEQVDAALEKLAGTDSPIAIPGGSLLGIPRNIIGFERIAVLPYEDPELFKEIVDSFGACICAVLERTLPKVQVDCCMGWEDICFNQGPIISPHVVAEVAGPWYRRIADILALHGCCIYTTDTDGNILPIADTFIDNGLQTMFPVEVHGGTDPVLLRERYGKRVRLWGGVDKMALIHSKEAIEKELKRLQPCVLQGAFIPGVDHRVPADVPLDNYKFYLDKKRELFNIGGEPKYGI